MEQEDEMSGLSTRTIRLAELRARSSSHYYYVEMRASAYETPKYLQYEKLYFKRVRQWERFGHVLNNRIEELECKAGEKTSSES